MCADHRHLEATGEDRVNRSRVPPPPPRGGHLNFSRNTFSYPTADTVTTGRRRPARPLLRRSDVTEGLPASPTLLDTVDGKGISGARIDRSNRRLPRWNESPSKISRASRRVPRCAPHPISHGPPRRSHGIVRVITHPRGECKLLVIGPRQSLPERTLHAKTSSSR